MVPTDQVDAPLPPAPSSLGEKNAGSHLETQIVRRRRHPILIEEPQTPPSRIRYLLGHLWDTIRKPNKERKFVRRLDTMLLTYSMLSFVIKTIDSGNISNAYVSGMKEDLDLHDQERNLFNTFFDIGCFIGCVPSLYVLHHVRPSIWLPLCELIWSSLLMAMAYAKTAQQICVFRFFIGLVQAVAYPGFAMILGSWYVPEELAKRLCLYDGSYTIAHMLSGSMQAAVYRTMNGLLGMAGWRWLFIIEGAMSVPVALWGVFAIPDSPQDTRAAWLTPDMRFYGMMRMEEVGRKPRKKLTWRRVKGWMCTWRPYGYLLPFVMFTVSSTYNYFNLWLKSLGTFSVEQINLIPTAGNALGLISAYVLAAFSDHTLRRCPYLLIAIFFRFVSSVLLSIWNIPYGLKFFAFFLPMAGEPTWALLTTWVQEVFQDDAELRAFLPALGSGVGYAFKSWFPLLVFPTYEAPIYKWGYKVTTAIIVAEFFAVLWFSHMVKWEVRKNKVILNDFGLPVAFNDDDDCLKMLRATIHKKDESEEHIAADTTTTVVTESESLALADLAHNAAKEDL
ncbi:major facilitator superfamily domain-containing protein [Limtongia smithiae]|uniref:major facilitator superfamily domain-containing protein n=1 Tax=Limtongia smithiae TaxID=1125753 RepID=UPI0034CFC5A7